MKSSPFYLMENSEEAIRLEVKTDPRAVYKQALWCGVKPGMRVLDAGCGPGITTSILYEMVQPHGKILGIDYSSDRIQYARQHYACNEGIEFQMRDLRDPLGEIGDFDLIWVRFVLEYNLAESPHIVRNLSKCLKPGGTLCLLDLDYNCLNHYELSPSMSRVLEEIMGMLQERYNFDVYAGRKLYAYLYDLGYEELQVELMAHHLIYGDISETDLFNWTKKVGVASRIGKGLLSTYPGGGEAFYSDFVEFFTHPRRFTYSPLILCKGRKPFSG